MWDLQTNRVRTWLSYEMMREKVPIKKNWRFCSRSLKLGCWAVAWAPPACSIVRVRCCQTWAWSLHQLTAKIKCVAVNAAAQDIIYSLISSHLHRGAQHFRYSVPQCPSTSVVPGPHVCTKAGQYLCSHNSRKNKGSQNKMALHPRNSYQSL